MAQTTVEQRSSMSFEELTARATEMRGEWASLNKGERESDSYNAARGAFLAEMDDIDTHLTLHAMAARQAAGVRGVGNVPQLPPGVVEHHEVRGGRALVENAEFAAWVAAGARGGSPSVEVRTLIDNTTTSNYLTPVGQPFLGNVRQRRLFVRDLLTVQQTGLSQVPYVREYNAASDSLAASTVAQGAAKPEATLEFEQDNAIAQVIAVNVPVTTQMVSDSPTLAGYVDTRLSYMLKLREEDEVIRGNGISPDLKGIKLYSGVQTQSTAGSGEYAQTIGNAIAKIELVDGEADGVVMNPATFWAMVTHRASSGAGNFDAQAFGNAPIVYVWGLPVVRSNSVSANENLVGSWKLGATLFDRWEANVRVFEQHSDYAAKNKVLIQAEERVALAVFRPDFFVVATSS